MRARLASGTSVAKCSNLVAQGYDALTVPAMSDNPDAGRATPRIWWDPFGFWGGRVAPNELNQPILPGWVFAGTVTVNERNSSAPETEREIVAAESYGRQIGRISDALAVLIAEWPEGKPKPKAIREFEALRTRVDKIKVEASARRAERFLEDMAMLRRDNAAEFRRLAAEVRRLEAEGRPGLPKDVTSRGRGKGSVT